MTRGKGRKGGKSGCAGGRDLLSEGEGGTFGGLTLFNTATVWVGGGIAEKRGNGMERHRRSKQGLEVREGAGRGDEACMPNKEVAESKG